MKNTTVRSTDYKAVLVESWEVLVDAKPRYPAVPVIGLKADPYPGEGESFIMPIAFGTAKAVAMNILKTLLVEAPELFYKEAQRFF